ncbi:MAG: hypothetical protein ACREJO_11705 [Phycisphaerales bacterium]
MLIIWGTKVQRKTKGYVAEVCPNCIGVREIKLDVVSKVSHLYYIPLGDGTVVGYVGTCADCRGEFGLNPDVYPFYAQSSGLAMGDLVQQTGRAGLTDDAVEAAGFVHRVNTGQLSAQDRIGMVVRSITSDPEDWKRSKDIHIDPISGVLLALTFAAVIWTLIEFASQGPATPWRWIALAFAIVVTATMIWSFATANRRYAAGKMEPRIARELMAIKPKSHEINDACQLAIRAGLRIARHIGPARLERRIGGV